MMTAPPIRTFLSLGSNLGDRATWLRAGRDGLAALPQARLVLASPVYETEPWGDPDQGQYFNQVVALDLGPGWTARRLLEAIRGIENACGRRRDPARRFGPRTLDVDILLFGQEVVDEPDCIVPHPRLLERAFVLVPLADIAPACLVSHSGQGLTARQALAKIPFKISGNGIRAIL
jgi:2-amino-4-hydroxy-6-hydroxymethyldihydropteridine diphosphokinase